jgi:hypothetical protein
MLNVAGVADTLKPRQPDPTILWSVVFGLMVAGGIFWAVGKLPRNALTKPVKAVAKAAKG